MKYDGIFLYKMSLLLSQFNRYVHFINQDWLNWNAVSLNKHLPFEVVLHHKHEPWNRFWMSVNVHVDSLQTILDHPEIPWHYTGLSYNEHIPIEDFLNHPEIDWCWDFLSQHKQLTLEIVLNHMDKPWVWSYIIKHPNITLQDILDHPECPWDYMGLSMNPCITIYDILSHPDKPWIPYCVCENINIFKFSESFLRQHFAAKKIQRYFKQSISNPNYCLCQKRLKREFKELIS